MFVLSIHYKQWPEYLSSVLCMCVLCTMYIVQGRRTNSLTAELQQLKAIQDWAWGGVRNQMWEALFDSYYKIREKGVKILDLNKHRIPKYVHS